MPKFLLVFCLAGALLMAACDEDRPTSALPNPPEVSTGVITHAGPNVATVEGTVDVFGVEGSYWFEFGLDENYGSSTSEVKIPTVSAGPRTVNDTLTGLTPATTYHYRLVARNAGGSARGNDATLITTPANQAPSTQLTAAPADTLGTEVRWHLYWIGFDVDGSVVRFELRIVDHGPDGTLDPPDSLNVPWMSTASTDSTFTWQDGLGSRTFFVRAIDDRDARDPSPASRTIEALVR